jgi:hypothetical protein
MMGTLRIRMVAAIIVAKRIARDETPVFLSESKFLPSESAV